VRVRGEREGENKLLCVDMNESLNTQNAGQNLWVYTAKIIHFLQYHLHIH
jgi:hypothetical protein